MSTFWEFFDSIKPYLGNRSETFTKIFEYLDKFNRPVVIVESGCARQLHKTEEEDWRGDGQSTVLFGRYIQEHGGKVYSVDIDAEHVKKARALVPNVHVHCGDSVKHLTKLAKDGVVPDLVYLDSLDYIESDPFLTALHCGNEFQAIRPVIRSDTLIVCDDTPSVFVHDDPPQLIRWGKGSFLSHHAIAVGADTLFNSWQIGWTNMTGLAGHTTDADVDALIGRARNHVEANRAFEAETCYRAVITKTTPPKSGVDRVAKREACAYYARVAAQTGKYGTAADWYREAIMADPRCVDYRLELVTRCYRPMLNWQCAEQESLRAVSIEPNNENAWRILGDVHMAMVEPRKAARAYDREMELAPGDPHAMLDRCVIALDEADYDLVRKLAEKVLQTDRKADGIHVLAMIENRTGNHEKAIELFQQAIDAGCNNQATAHWNKSLSLHAIGRYKEGWVEHEWRKKETNNPALSIAFQRFSRPLWNLEPPPALIHVHSEAGIGDNIAMTRYLPELVRRGYKVRYEAHAEMTSLIARCFPDVEVIPRAPDYPGAIGIGNFDYHLPVGTMPYIFGTDIDTVPWEGPYLKAGMKATEYKQILPKGKKIGVCWSSGIRDYGIWLMEYGKRKSMHYDTFRPIVRTIKESGATPISLQVGPERLQAKNDPMLGDVLPQTLTWDDTAALVHNLDLVITVDTAVAHLAGAMGKPVWVMTQRDGASFHFLCWREGAFWNERSPWYPTARLFRQHRFNEPHFWDEVVSDIVQKLRVKARQAA